MLPLILLEVRQQQQLQQHAWYTAQSASSSCVNGQAVVSVSFSNTEPVKSSTAMKVVVTDLQSRKTLDLGSIAGGQTKTGQIQTGLTSLPASGVSYALTWTDGHSGTDSRSANYQAITCQATPSATPTSVPTATPTKTPTPTATATPVPTHTPTPIPTATPTPLPKSTTFSFIVFLHGIGNSGDNANPNENDLSNKNPVHTGRPFTVTVFNVLDQQVAQQQGNLTYSEQNGNYTGTVSMGTALTTGTYTVKINTDGFLRQLVPGIQNITAGDHVTMPVVSLVNGDAIRDNTLNILDYNVMIGCYSDILPAVSCDSAKKLLSDFTDDGNVNQFDYNLFIRELSVQNGD